jgi:DNA-binding XRE family transcriptional regulator
MEIIPSHRIHLRELCGLSLRDLADRTGISKTRLHLWENDEAKLHSNEVRTIRNTILELAGSNHREVRRLLSRTRVGRAELRPGTEVKAAPRERRSELKVGGK